MNGKTASPAGAVRRHRHIPALDGVRALAVGAVLLAHLGRGWSFAGALGVDVFFVLSGFLITSILLAEYAATGRLNFRRFYARRVLRLTPPLLLALVLFFPFRAYLFDLPMWQTAHHYAKTVVMTLTYVGNVADFKDQMGSFGHFWSLAVEEQFYLVWPALLLLLMAVATWRSGLLASLVAVLGLGFAAWNVWSSSAARGKDMYVFESLLPTRAWELLAGCLLAVVVSGGALVHLRERRWWSAVGVAGVLLFVAAMYHYRLAGPLTDDAYRGMWRLGVLAVTAAAVLMVLSLVMSESGPLAALLSWAPIAWIGKISYGLYVYHYPTYHILSGVLPATFTTAHPFLFDVTRMAAAFVVAGLSYALWERPFLRLKSSGRFGGRAPVEPATPTGTPAGARTAMLDSTLPIQRAVLPAGRDTALTAAPHGG